MKRALFFLFLVQLLACTEPGAKEEVDKRSYVGVCLTGIGCVFSELMVPAEEIDRALGKTNFWAAAPPNSTLVLETCNSKIEEDKSLKEIHASYGGTGEPMITPPADIVDLIRSTGCLGCPNTTKKISFHLEADDVSGDGYFFFNLEKGEAYLPNASYQQLFAGQEGVTNMVLDQFLRGGHLENYVIIEGQKWLNRVPVAMDIVGDRGDAESERKFKNEFEKTGRTRPHLKTNRLETEYTGIDGEGNPMSIWLTPAQEVCLPPGKFDALGFYLLGYIQVDGMVYLVTGIAVNSYEVRMTGYEEGSYTFNPEGYVLAGA